MKTYTVTSWGEYFPAAYVSNGFIGFRLWKDPFSGGLGLLSGFTGDRYYHHVQALCAVPVPVMTFESDGKALTINPLSQSYDFSCGEFETKAQLNDENGNEAAVVTYNVFCSRTSPTLFCSSLSLKSKAPVKVSFTLDIAENLEYLISETVDYDYSGDDFDGKRQYFSCDRTTSAGAAFRIFGGRDKERPEHMKATFFLDDGEKADIVTSYVPSVMHDEPYNQAHRMVKLAAWSGMDRIREQNRKAWAELWKSRITVDGAGEEWQDVIDASFFYLLSSMSEFSPASVAPFGLSNINSYEGHCFWDTESFMFMTPLFCAPRIAESMLDYRFKRMGAAENNARLNGYNGIQFPWQSGATGAEVTVPFAGQAGGAGEQHVNLDIALAFDGYVRMTGDTEFLRDKAWKVIREVAKWIESRVEKTERGYEILHVTGIDEESDDVSNDSYTNIMSARILRSASEYSKLLGYGEREKWLEIADKLFIPVRGDGVLMQYENMPDLEKQPSTTLMSFFPYGYSMGEKNDLATFNYYIEHGMENYLRYPMLSGYLGVFPAWAGDKAKALDFYGKSNLTFFCDPFFACTEWSMTEQERKNPEGRVTTSFMTARGSLLSGLLMGLTKICPWKGGSTADMSEWLGSNIVLPEGWKRVTLGRIYIRGKAYRAIAENGAERTVLEEIE